MSKAAVDSGGSAGREVGHAPRHPSQSEPEAECVSAASEGTATAALTSSRPQSSTSDDLDTDEINLVDQRPAVARMLSEMRRLEMPLIRLEALSGVSMNSIYMWAKAQREPTLGKFVALATVLGFDVILRKRTPK